MKRGLIAEYRCPEALIDSARRLRELGYRDLDAFTPYPVPELDEALQLRRSIVPPIVLVAALCGGGGAYFLQWWMNAYNYPIDVGGRPPHSALAFVPITFEMTVLFAGVAAFVAVFVLGRLTALDHPLFDAAGFDSATVDGFWLGVDSADPRFDHERTAADLAATAPARVEEVGRP
jgi:hypothetical protein